jgi:3-methyladenine DNA glycosylase AlkD
MCSILVDDIQAELDGLADPQAAAFAQRFFKTGPGQYGEGDIFRGIRVPVLRRLAKKYKDLSLPNVERLLNSPFHEDRLVALFVLVSIHSKGDERTRREAYSLYLNNTRWINNWDLVDSSAEHIVGPHLGDGNREMLVELARSNHWWERRIAVMATFHTIRKREYDATLQVAGILLHDPVDLIHKAVGWMLREIGKRDIEVEEKFLRSNYAKMPRTMLRYALERFPEPARQAYLKGTIAEAP